MPNLKDGRKNLSTNQQANQARWLQASTGRESHRRTKTCIWFRHSSKQDIWTSEKWSTAFRNLIRKLRKGQHYEAHQLFLALELDWSISSLKFLKSLVEKQTENVRRISTGRKPSMMQRLDMTTDPQASRLLIPIRWSTDYSQVRSSRKVTHNTSHKNGRSQTSIAK